MQIDLINKDGSETSLVRELTEAEKHKVVVLENAYQNLRNHFNLTEQDAADFIAKVPIHRLASLWNLHQRIMPQVRIVMQDLMEKVSGNIQMVEDLMYFEVLMWSDKKAAWEKYSIVLREGLAGRTQSSIVTVKQTRILETLGTELILPLIKPLRENLTAEYQARHPNQTVRIGRNIEEFKRLTHIYYNKRVPEFMYDNSNIIGMLEYPQSSSSSSTAGARNVIKSETTSLNGNTIMLAADLIIALAVIAFIIHTLRAPLHYMFFDKRKQKSKAPESEMRRLLEP
jgi:hypothetical protein